MAGLRGGLIQMSLKANTGDVARADPRAMVEAHLPLIDEAGRRGVQVLCLQEVFTQPYFCPSQDAKWYAAAEPIPDGPTVKLLQARAKKHRMVIVAPLYEEAMTGVYYNTAAVLDADGSYLGKYRKTHIPQVAGFYEKFFFKPGNSGWPVFSTRLLPARRLHLLRPALPRRLARAGPERRGIHRQPFRHGGGSQPVSLGARAAGLRGGQRLLHRRGEPGGTEAPWNIGEFYGSSYFVNPRGKIIAKASADKDELIDAEMDMDMVREVRNLWQFFRDRRPETYQGLTQI